MIGSDFTRVRSETERLTLLRVPRPIDVVQVQTTATTVFTALDVADFQIEALFAANTTSTGATITLHIVPPAGSVSAANQILFQMAVAANGRTMIFNRENMMMLQPGYSLIALGGVNNAVNAYGYGYDYQGQYST